MDTSQYIQMFLAECREHLQELNLAIVRVEERPDDSATVDEIFRIAHSLKGMSATMGFQGMAALTHEMEDVFELLRKRTDGLSRDAVDILLECLDALSAAIDGIEADGTERLDPAALAERLQGLVRERTPDQAVARHGGEATTGTPEPVAGAMAAGQAVLHARATLDEETLMPAVRAYMVLAAAADLGTVVASAPEAEDVEAFDGRVIDVWVAAEVETEALQAALAAVPDVAAVEVDDDRPTGEDAPKLAAVATLDYSRTTTTVRVDAERLDQLMHLMGELVVQRTRVEALSAEAEVPGLSRAMQELTRCSQALQAIVMQVRMIPVEAVFLRLPRLVRDLSAKLGKQVELELVGQDTELDRTVVDALGDPLVHLVRNALDHGFETAAEREAAGKPATGALRISARHSGGNVIISVADDGRGVDPAAIAVSAVRRGLLTPEQAEGLEAARAIDLLFAPGFSTREAASGVSGRGIGMDAVRAKVREVGGEVWMSSEHGQGTVAQIRLPLTLAIMPALLVYAGGRTYGIALDRIDRSVMLAEHAVRSAAGQRMLVVGDAVMPLHDAATALGHPADEDCEFAVIVHGHDRRVALAVSELIGQHELVTRPLPPDVAALAPLSGAAVLPDGDIALLVDCDALTIDSPAAALARAA
ncbi:MAG: two-component system, chemotaxis family, sensor kinase CheA [Solirubrobacteraceae bacterium]